MNVTPIRPEPPKRVDLSTPEWKAMIKALLDEESDNIQNHQATMATAQRLYMVRLICGPLKGVLE